MTDLERIELAARTAACACDGPASFAFGIFADAIEKLIKSKEESESR